MDIKRAIASTIGFGDIVSKANLYEKHKKKIAQMSGEIDRIGFYRYGATVQIWRSALDWAEGDLCRFDELQKLYYELILDTQVSGAMQQRTLATVGSKWTLQNESGDTLDEGDLLARGWFEDYVRYVLEAKYYGFTGVEFEGLENGSLSGVNSIRREFINPVKRIVTKNIGDDKGVSFDDNLYKGSTVLVTTGTLGILNEVAPLVIWKKDALGFWSQYGELFGSPFRIGRTDVYDKTRVRNMEAMLKEMGSNAYAVLHEGDELELVESSKADVYNVFSNLVEHSDKGISKAFLGQTMTMDDGSSHSQAKVHNSMFNDLVQTDKRFVERNVSGELLPRLRALGIAIPENAVFKWEADEKLDFEEKKGLLEVLLPHFDIDPEKIKEFVDLEVTEKAPGETGDLSAQLREINALYKGFNDHKH